MQKITRWVLGLVLGIAAIQAQAAGDAFLRVTAKRSADCGGIQAWGNDHWPEGERLRRGDRASSGAVGYAADCMRPGGSG